MKKKTKTSYATYNKELNMFFLSFILKNCILS